jgi:DNA-binding NarL/FixJ family response regulator
MNGLEATKLISKECEQAKVLMLTQYDDDENVLASSKMGALGFIPKRSASSELLDGIRTVDQGKHFMHPVTV